MTLEIAFKKFIVSQENDNAELKQEAAQDIISCLDEFENGTTATQFFSPPVFQKLLSDMQEADATDTQKELVARYEEEIKPFLAANM